MSFVEKAGKSDARNIAGFPVEQWRKPCTYSPQQWLADACLGFSLPDYFWLFTYASIARSTNAP
jgi:hypothetical protein